MEPQSVESDEGRWQELLAHHELMQATANAAWRALLDANKLNSEGMYTPTDELIRRCKTASTLRFASEQALISFASARGWQSPQ